MVEKFIPKCGYFAKEKDGSFKWRELIHPTGLKYILHSPKECGLTREAAFKIFVLKEVKDETEYEGTKKYWFVQDCTITIREDVSSNIWLRFNDVDRQYYLCDISELGLRLRCPLQSDNNIIAEKTDLRPIATEIVKKNYEDKSKPFYGYSRIEGNDPNSLSYGVTV